MNNKIKANKIAKSANILPKLMHYFSSSFKPSMDTPIKKNEVRTIIEIYFHPGLPMKHYIDSVDMESGSFTYLADKLEKKEIIIKTPSEKDKREIYLFLTKKGKILAEKMMDKFDSHISNLIETLSDEDLEILENAIQSLEKIYNKLK